MDRSKKHHFEEAMKNLKPVDGLEVLPKRREQALINLAKKAKKLQRIRALFSGPCGPGKSLAAELLARKLEVKLYRIDLGRSTQCANHQYI